MLKLLTFVSGELQIMIVIREVVVEHLAEEHGERVGTLGDAFHVGGHVVRDVDEEVFGEAVAQLRLGRLRFVRQRLLAMSFANREGAKRYRVNENDKKNNDIPFQK